jgi:hypothetical protein
LRDHLREPERSVGAPTSEKRKIVAHGVTLRRARQ